jgi:hypothetical protein
VAYAQWPGGIGLLDHREDFSLGANSHAGCPERSATVRSGDRTAWVENRLVIYFTDYHVFWLTPWPKKATPSTTGARGEDTSQQASAGRSGLGGKTLARRALTVHIIASRQDAMGRTRLRGSFCLKGCPQQAHYKEQQNFNDAPLQIAPLKST